MIDLRCYLGVELEAAKDKELNIADLAPAVKTSATGKDTPCHRLIETPTGGRRGDDTMFTSVGTLIVDFSKTELRTRKGEFMGYHFVISVNDKTTSQEEASFSSTESPAPAVPAAKCQFVYDLDANSFYPTQEDPTGQGAMPSSPVSAVHRTYTSRAEQLNSAQRDEAPRCCDAPFFRQIYPLLIRMPSLLGPLESKKLYSEGVSLYRLIPGGKVVAINDSATQQASLVESALLCREDEGRTESNSNSEKDSIKIMRVALRSKEYVAKVLKQLSLPKGFFWVSLVCLLSTGLAIAMSAIMYATYMSLLAKLKDEMALMYFLPVQYKSALMSTIYLMQTLAVSEYVSRSSKPLIEDGRAWLTRTRSATRRKSSWGKWRRSSHRVP